ncbi:hypothetical protein [Bradyrhizobium sp.]|uniref:hypothetical protein n=1 Tax=Bradyrhizobium sp. TaxID=376 RepID=UPI003C787115
MRFLALSALVLLSSWPLEFAPAAEVRCASGIYGRYTLPQDEGWFRRRWPSGVRPTGSTCASGFIFGPIEPGDYEKVRALYRPNHPFLASFILASPGGDVVEAIKIGQLFRKYLIRASAPIRFLGGETFTSISREPECESGRCICASACALMWFGAVDRGGSVGLHRPRTDDPDFRALGPIEGANAYRGVLDSIRQYLDEMEVPKPMIEAMVATGSADIKWVDADDDLRRPPSLAEWEDATCGSFSIKDKNLLYDLRAKHSNLAQLEQNLRDQLQSRQSKWAQCRIELLSSNRDKLSVP